MRYYHLLIVILLAGSVQSQSKVTFDFETKKLTMTDLGELSEGELYQLEIKNINLNLYKVIAAGRDSTIYNEISFPSFSSLNISSINDLVSGLANSITTIVKEAEPNNPSAAPRTGNLREPTVQELMERDAEVFKDFLDGVEAQMGLLLSNYNNFGSIIAEVDIVEKRIVKFYVSSFRNSGYIADISISNTLDSIQEVRKKLYALKIQVIGESVAYQNSLSKFDKNLLESPLSVNSLSVLSNTRSALLTLVDSTMKNVDLSDMEQRLKTITFLRNNMSVDASKKLSTLSTYISIPLQHTGDASILNFSIIPLDPRSNLSSYHSGDVMFPLKSNNYFSIGGAFYSSSLSSDQVSKLGYAEGDTVAGYTIFKEKGAGYEIGVATLIRVGKKNESGNGRHFLFGPGISISKPIKPRLLIGGGLSYGKKHNLTIEGGLVVGYVDRLSGAISEGTILKQLPDNILYSRLLPGAFISLGYQFIL